MSITIPDIPKSVWAIANHDMPDNARKLLSGVLLTLLDKPVSPETVAAFINDVSELFSGVSLEVTREIWNRNADEKNT